MIKPYFETDLVKLYNADCLDVMREMEDKSIDLVLTDPPYGIGAVTNRAPSDKRAKTTNYGKFTWNDNIPTEETFNEMIRISKEQIIWGVNYYPYKNIFPSGRLVWDKNNESSTFSNCDLASISLIESIKIFRYTWNGMIQEDMKNKETRVHPTQKPVALLKWCLDNYAETYELIFDPFAGSGSTLIACEELGYKCIGIEKEKDYCDTIVNRLENITRNLF